MPARYARYLHAGCMMRIISKIRFTFRQCFDGLTMVFNITGDTPSNQELESDPLDSDLAFDSDLYDYSYLYGSLIDGHQQTENEVIQVVQTDSPLSVPTANMTGFVLRELEIDPVPWNPQNAFIQEVVLRLYLFVPGILCGILLGLIVWGILVTTLRSGSQLKRKCGRQKEVPDVQPDQHGRQRTKEVLQRNLAIEAMVINVDVEREPKSENTYALPCLQNNANEITSL